MPYINRGQIEINRKTRERLSIIIDNLVERKEIECDSWNDFFLFLIHELEGIHGKDISTKKS